MVKKVNPDAILALNSMGLFLSEKHIYHTSNMPYKKVAELVRGEYPDTEHFRKLISYYEFVGEREKENFEKAEKIIVLSKKIQENIIEQGIAEEKITYVHRAIPKLYGEWPKKEGKMKIILMPAELRVMKGVRYALETMKILKKRVPEAVLVMCGRTNNYEQEYMKQLINDARGKANIITAGFAPKEIFYGYMRMAECAFMPFCFDECPIALSECIGHGLPVVTNEYAGFERQVIDRFGYCARYKDVEDYADALEKMLTEPDFRDKKARGAREVTDEFTFESYKKGINDVFAKG